MNCRVYSAPARERHRWARGLGQMAAGCSHESEHDLAAMVREFLENGGSGDADSWYSSDSDSGLPDLAHLDDKITAVEFEQHYCYHCLSKNVEYWMCLSHALYYLPDHMQLYKYSVAQYEHDLQSVVHSLMLSISDANIQIVTSGACNASCIRFFLVKLLRHSGYDAAVCSSKWQGNGKVPGGDYEYIDVNNHNTENSERVIIDIDFRSHFEIARAVESYDKILNSLPVVYVGSLSKLKQLLQVMVEAARSSLKQNSMPLPPWRSLAYLQKKWHSPYQRQVYQTEQSDKDNKLSDHKQCVGHLKRLQSSIQSEAETERLLKPINIDNSQRLKFEKRRSLLWAM